MKICMRPSVDVGDPAPTRSNRKSMSRIKLESFSILSSRVSYYFFVAVFFGAVAEVEVEATIFDGSEEGSAGS